MKTKEETIHDMCLTMRHDYGLENPEDRMFGCGMTKTARMFLYDEMSQLYDHHIAPLQKIIDNIPNGSFEENSKKLEVTYHVGYYKDSEFWSTYETDTLDAAKNFVRSQQKHYGDKKLIVIKKTFSWEEID